MNSSRVSNEQNDQNMVGRLLRKESRESVLLLSMAISGPGSLMFHSMLTLLIANIDFKEM